MRNTRHERLNAPSWSLTPHFVRQLKLWSPRNKGNMCIWNWGRVVIHHYSREELRITGGAARRQRTRLMMATQAQPTPGDDWPEKKWRDASRLIVEEDPYNIKIKHKTDDRRERALKSYTTMTQKFWAVLKKIRKQHSIKQQLYGHLPNISQTLQVRQTRHARSCWKSKDEFIRDIWIYQYQRTNEDWEGTGCRLENLPRAFTNRERCGRETMESVLSARSDDEWWKNYAFTTKDLLLLKLKRFEIH